MQSRSEPSWGPVSQVLFNDIKQEADRHGIIVWLDRDNHYSDFVDRLPAKDDDLEVHAFRGSHLSLMLALEASASGVDTPRLLVHAPGTTEDDIRQTPMLELYLAGRRYRRALPTLVERAASGKVAATEVAELVQSPDLSLARADQWLHDKLSGGGELAALLRSLSASALLDDLLRGGPVAGALSTPDGQRTLGAHLEAALGLPPGWGPGLGHGAIERDRRASLAHTIATWALSVEYVDDLKREPVSAVLSPTEGLSPTVVQSCCGLARSLCTSHRDLYEQAALEMEERLVDEVRAAQAADLGHVDTFRFEEDSVLAAAISILESQEGMDTAPWDQVIEWSERRLEQGSFWLDREPERRTAWRLIDAMARLGRAIVRAGPRLDALGQHAGALQRYVDHGAAVDRAHRHLEQLRVLHAYDVRVPRYEELRRLQRSLREQWHWWASEWARDYAQLCREAGALPPPSLQQRTLFDEVVRPMAEERGVTAYFMVDAFRFELAQELAESLGNHPATVPRLEARLAELPTNTEVGMNALAPVSENGRLQPVIKGGKEFDGFRAGEFVVRDPETRRRAIAARVGGRTCPLLRLDEVLAESTEGLRRRIAQSQLLVVWSDEIDKAGETGAGPAIFASTLQQLRAAWHSLRDAGVRRFVFTADHGFLLLDKSDAKLRQPHGQKTTPSRRHVLSPAAADHPDELRVPLAELDYDAPPLHLMVPDSVKVFHRGKKPMSFVHGGNSLQERVIPVFTLVHRSPAGGDTARYTLTAAARPPLMGRHCIRLLVKREQETLGFGASDDVELVVKVVDSRGHSVHLHDTRGGTAGAGGVISAPVGRPCEVFFSITGPDETRVQVVVEPFVRSTPMEAAVVRERFTVAARPSAHPGPETAPAPASDAWLEALPADGVRDVFRHLSVHGSITEAELAGLLGGPRKARRFGRSFEAYLAVAPFDARVEAGASGKRYVRI